MNNDLRKQLGIGCLPIALVLVVLMLFISV